MIFGGSLGSSFYFGHSHPAMIVWASLALIITASPILAWWWTTRREKRTEDPGGSGATPGSGAGQGTSADASSQPGPATRTDQTVQIALEGCTA